MTHPAGIKLGEQREQERIIALLQEFYDGNLWRQIDSTTYEGFNMAELIDLIRKTSK